MNPEIEFKSIIAKYGLEVRAASNQQEAHDILKDTASKGLLLVKVINLADKMVFTRTKEEVHPSLVEALMDSIEPTP